jgi:hypothetical protein
MSEYTPAPGLFPTGHLPGLREQALARYADALETELTEV